MAYTKGKILQILSLGLLTTGTIGGLAACGSGTASSGTSTSDVRLIRVIQDLTADDFEKTPDISFKHDEYVDSDANSEVAELDFYTAITGMSVFQTLPTDLKTKFKLSDLSLSRDVDKGSIKLTIKNHSSTRNPKVIKFEDFLTPENVSDLKTALSNITPEAFSGVQFKKDQLPSSKDNSDITENLLLGQLKTYLEGYGGDTSKIPQIVIDSITSNNIRKNPDDGAGTIKIDIVNLPNQVPSHTVEIDGFLTANINALKVALADIAAAPVQVQALGNELGLNPTADKYADADPAFDEEKFISALRSLGPINALNGEVKNQLEAALVSSINVDRGAGEITVTMLIRDDQIDFHFTGYEPSEGDQKLTAAIDQLTAADFITPELYNNVNVPANDPANLYVNSQKILDVLKNLQSFGNVPKETLDRFVPTDITIDNLPTEGKIVLTFRNHGPVKTVEITGFITTVDFEGLETTLKNIDETELTQILGWDQDSTFPSENPNLGTSDQTRAEIANKIKTQSPAFATFSQKTKDEFNYEWIKTEFNDDGHNDANGKFKLTIQNPEKADPVKVYDLQFQKRIDLDDYLDPDNWSVTTNGAAHLKTRQFIKNDPEVGGEQKNRSLFTTRAKKTFVMDQGGLYLFDPDHPDNNGNALQLVKKGEGLNGVVYEVDWHKVTGLAVGPQYRTFVFWAKTNTVEQIVEASTPSGFTTKDSGWDLNGVDFEDSFVYQVTNGQVYVGSNNKGLMRLRIQGNKPGLVQVSTNDKYSNQKLGWGFMYEVHEKDGSTTIYYGGWTGNQDESILLVLDPSTGKSTPAQLSGGGNVIWMKVPRMTQTAEGEIFLTRWADGLLHRKEDKTFEPVYNRGQQPGDKPRDTGTGFITYLNGKLLISSYQADDYNKGNAIQGIWEIVQNASDKWELVPYDDTYFLETFGSVADEVSGNRVYFIARQGIFRLFADLPEHTKYQYLVNNGSYSDKAPTSLKKGDVVHVKVVPESDEYKINYLYPELTELTVTVS